MVKEWKGIGYLSECYEVEQNEKGELRYKSGTQIKWSHWQMPRAFDSVFLKLLENTESKARPQQELPVVAPDSRWRNLT